jgi:putative ABC transport system ATP-binding protein
MGPSGSGKSTLLGIVSGLDHPTAGEVVLDGRDISNLSEREMAALRADRVGMVFQSYNLIPTLTALENVQLPLLVPGRHSSSNGHLERARELLREVGLGHRLNHRPSQLSGGEQQRVGVARALATDPALRGTHSSIFCSTCGHIAARQYSWPRTTMPWPAAPIASCACTTAG